MYSPRRQRASLIVTIISVLAAVALIIAGEGTAPPALTGAGLVLCLFAFLFSIVAYWFFGPRFRKIGVDEESQLNDARRMLGEPFQTSVKLAADEAILYSDVAQLVTTKYSVTLAQPDRNFSKTKGGVTGAMVGGLLLGPVGAVAG